MPTNQLKVVCNSWTYSMPLIVSDQAPTRIKESKETANSPIETNTAIVTFNPSFIDLGEKAGFRRKRPRTKAVYAAMNNIMNPVLVNNKMRVAWGLKTVVTAVTTPAIGTAISQPFSNMALTNLPSPECAFRNMKRLMHASKLACARKLTKFFLNVKLKTKQAGKS